jgi:WD40 repeat protein
MYLDNLKVILPSELIKYINEDYVHLIEIVDTPFGTIELRGHNMDITDIYEDDDSDCLFITGSKDRTARIWNTNEKKCIAILEHENDVCVVFLKSSLFLAITATTDNMVCFWDIKKIVLINKIKMEYNVHKICIVENRFVILYTKYNHCVYDLWKERSIRNTYNFTMYISPYSIDEKHVTIDCNNNIILKDINDIFVAKFIGHRDKINDIIYLSEHNKMISCSDDNTVKIWDTKTYLCCDTIYFMCPQKIRSICNNVFMVVCRTFDDFITYYLYNITKKHTYHLTTLYLQNITNRNYNILNVDFNTSKHFVIITMELCSSVDNSNIYVISILNSSVKRKIAKIIMSKSKPTYVTNNILIIQSNDGFLLILDLDNDSLSKLKNLDGNITFYNKQSKSQYLMLGFESGKCLLNKISTSLTLEQFLLLFDLESCKKANKILPYIGSYDKLLFSILNENKCLFVYLIKKYLKELCNYLERCGFDTKSINSSNRKIDFIEFCNLCNYEYFVVCE